MNTKGRVNRLRRKQCFLLTDSSSYVKEVESFVDCSSDYRKTTQPKPNQSTQCRETCPINWLRGKTTIRPNCSLFPCARTSEAYTIVQASSLLRVSVVTAQASKRYSLFRLNNHRDCMNKRHIYYSKSIIH
jgi:hypothetical protein